MRTEEIVKKEKTKYKIGRLADEDTEEGEVDKKATDEEEDDAEKSKGGASGSQSDHSMPEAGSSGDIALTDDMTVNLHRVQFPPVDRDYFLSGGGGDSDDGDDDDFDDEDEDEEDDDEYEDYDDDDDGDDDDGGDGGSGDDDPDGVVKKVARRELLFSREEVERLIGPAVESTFRMMVAGYDTYDAIFERRERFLRRRIVEWFRLAGPVWDEHMKLFLHKSYPSFILNVVISGKINCPCSFNCRM